MSNTIDEVLPKMLAQGLLALREQAIMSRLVNRSYEGLAAQKGNVINVPIPSAIAARAVTPANAMASNVDFAPTSAQVTLDFWQEAPFHLSDNDMVSVRNGTIPMQASEAIKALGNAVDSYILGKHTGFYGFAGTAGTTPFASAITVAGDARKLLNKQLAPMGDRRVVLDPDAESNALLLTNILQFDQRGDQGGIVAGSIGRKLGMDWYMDQNVSEYTPGASWVTGFTVATGGGSEGDLTLSVQDKAGTIATGTIKVGDIFTLASQNYVVTAQATAASSASTAFTLSIYPPLAAAAASGAVTTVVGSAYVPNLAFHRDAIAWASRPLASIQGLGNAIQSAADPVTGVALRLEVSRQYKQTTFSYDVLGGANVIRPELGVKIAG